MPQFKPIVWETPDKVLATSGHTVWDRQVELLTPGQHEDQGLRSLIIPGVDQVRQGKSRYQTGELRDLALAEFPDISDLVRDRVLETTATGAVVLYELRHYAGKIADPKKIVHGYILTRLDGTFLYAIADGPTHRSQVVVRFALPYVAHSIPVPWDEATSRRFHGVKWPEPTTVADTPVLAGV